MHQHMQHPCRPRGGARNSSSSIQGPQQQQQMRLLRAEPSVGAQERAGDHLLGTNAAAAAAATLPPTSSSLARSGGADEVDRAVPLVISRPVKNDPGRDISSMLRHG
jgi:hypothetical protein